MKTSRLPRWVLIVMDVRGQQRRLAIQTIIITMMLFGTALSSGGILTLLLTLCWASIAFHDVWLYLKVLRYISAPQVGQEEDDDAEQ